MKRKSTRERRNKHFTLSCSPEEYARMRALRDKSINGSFSAYARRVLLKEPVTITCRNLSLDALIDELNGWRNQLELLMARDPEPMEIESIKNILHKVGIIADKIIEQCIPK